MKKAAIFSIVILSLIIVFVETKFSKIIKAFKDNIYNERSGYYDFIIVHHSASPINWDVEDIRRVHVDENEWPDIGYHFVIDWFGRVYQTNKTSKISYHTSGMNGRSIGICLIGNFEEISPSNSQYKALKKLIFTINTMRLLTGRKRAKIGIHKQYVNTLCPGKNFNTNILT